MDAANLLIFVIRYTYGEPVSGEVRTTICVNRGHRRGDREACVDQNSTQVAYQVLTRTDTYVLAGAAQN